MNKCETNGSVECALVVRTSRFLMQVSLLEIKSAISSDMLLGYSDKPTYVALLQRPNILSIPKPGQWRCTKNGTSAQDLLSTFFNISPREMISTEQMNGFIPRTLPSRLTAKASWMRLQMSSTTACTKAWADDHRCLFAGSFL